MSNVGVDFGTTNSLLVAFDKVKCEFTYFNFSKGLGRSPIPTSSTVWYHDNITEIGEKARENINKFADVEGHHFEKSIKLKLGTEQHLNIFGNAVEPYEVAGTILSHLKKTAIEDWQAAKAGVDLNKAVFTVPINFNGKARQDLRKSANEAGIEITTFIHEPFAATVGYFFSKYQGNSTDIIVNKLKEMNGKHLLVFDWGGGTLDITVVKIKNNKMVELGTTELTNIAGDKFDEDIANYAWNLFLEKYGYKYNDEYLDAVKRKKWDRLLACAERCKFDLSKYAEADFILEKVTSGNEDIDLTIPREKFEEIIGYALDAACNKIDDALKQAGIQEIDISNVLLTGGSCYIPAVKARMIEKFGRRVEEVKNADLVIAQGAAVISEMGWLPFLTKDIQIKLSDGSYWPIFEHGTPIASQEPAHNSEEFSCTDSRQKRAKVIVCEGLEQEEHKNLAVLNIPLLGDSRFGDDILVEAELNRDIVLLIKGYSKMVQGYSRDDNYTIRKTSEIFKLCFGLDFGGIHNEF